MSTGTNGRPKRASKRPAIIEISDSDDEEVALASIAEKKSCAKNRRVDAASTQAAGKAVPAETSRQRWPTKDKNSSHPRAAAAASTSDDAAATCTSNAENSRDMPDGNTCSGGRSSFWGRRQVWTIGELLAETQQIDGQAANKIVQLFENDNTIPFICRYRRDLVNNLTPERLRDIKNAYNDLMALRKRAQTLVTQLDKEHPMAGAEVRDELLCAKTAEELEFLYAPYKPANRGSLVERAIALGLDVFAERLLFGEAPPLHSLDGIVQPHNADLDSVEKVTAGICNIIAHNMSKHTSVLEELRRLRNVHRILLKSSKAKATAKKNEERPNNNNNNNNNTMKSHQHNNNDASKFETYFEYQCDVRHLKPHQVLAINRGDKLKFLSVRVEVPDYLKLELRRFLCALYLSSGERYALRTQIFERAYDECYAKKLQPLLVRQIRADLTESAKRAAIDVFAKNLKQLLLMSPLKGERILGIDPGFAHGCKLAVVSEAGVVLQTQVLYPHTRNTDPETCGEELAKTLLRHNCSVIALGNGTACRETEFWLSKLFELGILDSRRIRYSIVSEQGASIYSCSALARQEFPQMDVNEISAVSIARRLIDPLSEWVKIEARHIGVGMYQHDLNEKALSESLNEIVSECVSYVGVDLNTASLSALKHVAGLSEKKATQIIAHRAENGPFRTRQQLLDVKTIGQKTFVQCAGFVRIEPSSLGDDRLDNALDCTWVHPESYPLAKKIITLCKLKLTDIGSDDFIARIKTFAESSDMDRLAVDFKMPKERLAIVLLALQRAPLQDYRCDYDMRPLFKRGIVRLGELNVGEMVTGGVTNVTHFGAFVDIGVECDGLIHTSKMAGTQLGIGDRVTASIVQVDVKRRRIGLRLEQMLAPTDMPFTLDH